MAPKGIKRTTIETPLSDDDRRSDEQAEAYEEFEEEVPGFERVKCYRFNPTTGKFAYVGVFPREVFSTDWLKTEYGGGKWSVRWLDKDGKLLKSRTVEIAGPYRDLTKEPGQVAQAAGRGEGGADAMFLKVLEAQEKRADDFKDLLLAALGNRPQQGGGLDDMLKLMAAVESFRPRPGEGGMTPAQMLTELRSAYREGMEDADLRSPSKSEPFVEVVRDVGKPLVEMLGAMAGRRSLPAAAPAPHMALPPAPAEPNAVNRGDLTVQTNAPAWLVAVAPDLPLLVGMAKRSIGADLVVDMILERIPPHFLDLMQGESLAPEWPEQMLGALTGTPLATLYGPWTLTVLRALQTELQRPPDGEDARADDDEGGAS